MLGKSLGESLPEVPERESHDSAAAPVEDSVQNEVFRALHDVGELLEHACVPAPEDEMRAASLAREILKQRETIHAQARLIKSLRDNLAARGRWMTKSEDRRRGLEGELTDLRRSLDETGRRAAEAEKRAASARDVAMGALTDKERTASRADETIRHLAQRHARALSSRDREHAIELQRHSAAFAAQHDRWVVAEEAHAHALAAEKTRGAQELAEHEERAACAQQRALEDLIAAVKRREGVERELAAERDARMRAERHGQDLEAAIVSERETRDAELAILTAYLEDVEKALARERADLAASVAAHARDLASTRAKREEALTEQRRVHGQESMQRVRAHAKALAEQERAHAAELASIREAVTDAEELPKARDWLRELEQSLASTRAGYAREVADWKLQLAGLREATAAEQRLLHYRTGLLARAHAELAGVRGALDGADREAITRELARDAVAANEHGVSEAPDHSAVRMRCAELDDDSDESDDTLIPGVSRRRSLGC